MERTLTSSPVSTNSNDKPESSNNETPSEEFLMANPSISYSRAAATAGFTSNLGVLPSIPLHDTRPFVASETDLPMVPMTSKMVSETSLEVPSTDPTSRHDHSTVCESCRQLLLSIYDHCMQPVPTLPSSNISIPPTTNEAPPNPLTTLHLPAPHVLATRAILFKDPKQTIQTESMVNKARVNDTRVHVQYREQELSKVRAHLFQKQMEEKVYKEQNQKMRDALKETLHFCSNMDTWQKKETENLQITIQKLKEQISSLMAIYIHLDEERKKVEDEKKAAVNEAKVRDGIILKKNEEIYTLQEKLHHFYKDYKVMHDKAQGLELEAIQGSSSIEVKSKHLSKQLDKLAIDFEKTSRQLTSSQERTRQLEFELSLVISQFNDVGDERKLLKEDFNEVTKQLQQLENKYEQLNSKHEDALYNINMFQDQLSQEKTEHAKYRMESVEKMTELQDQCAQLTKIKMHLEEIVARLKAETEKLRTSMIDIRALNTDLETNFTKYQVQSQSDIKELNRKIAQQKEDILRLQDEAQKAAIQREKMVAQLNDHRGMLDRERTRASQMDSDLRALRKIAAQEKWDFEEQIQNLNHTKKTLIVERKELEQNLDATKEELIALKSKFIDLEANFSDYSSTKENEVEGLESSLLLMKDALTKLTSQHGHLTYDHRNLQSELKDLEQDKKALQEIVEQKEKELLATHTLNSALQKEKMNLQERLEQLSEEDAKNREKIEAQIHFAKELSIKEERREEEVKLFQLQAEAKFSELSDRYYQLKEQYNSLQMLYDQSIKSHNHTKRELLQTKEHLMEESASRSIIEISIDEMRSRYLYERRNRMDLMKMQDGIYRKASDWKREKLEMWANRESTWEEIDHWLSNQLNRLNKLVDVMESDPFSLSYSTNFKQPLPSSTLTNNGKEINSDHKS
ncbi:hypothetical protein HMI54_007998 [Coelomomyces lativittatus]|nr:hypothetical protein HMI56_005984 [Coelomomyces lativittatus]KAJ1516049.1 hypothetical protein HMI55_003084 [Coelomomyces lativittatus]KAJ1516836.1 hypothetical protein HMI54_007998 [Coelomomyces lativittatus]